MLLLLNEHSPLIQIKGFLLTKCKLAFIISNKRKYNVFVTIVIFD